MNTPSHQKTFRRETDYVIRGGVAGRERLRALARVLEPSTKQLLRKAGVGAGAYCIDVGCGGGDVSLLLSRMVGPTGRVVGVDTDEEKLALARYEADWRGRGNVEFSLANVDDLKLDRQFDFVYSRFLLTHLREPDAAVAKMFAATLPQGAVIVEDIDFRGHFCHPTCQAFDRYVELYQAVVEQRGADPNIGPQLPGMLENAGLRHVRMNVVQPAGAVGDVKWMAAITLENIAAAVVAADLATVDEIETLIAELREFAAAPKTIMSLPRIFQVWGYKA